MKIYKKTAIILALTLSLLVVMLFVTSEFLLMDSFSRLEEKETKAQTERALSALQDEIAEINAFATDWAEWDDTYRFVQDGNGDYIRSNIVNQTFTNFELNILLYLDNAGEVVLGRTFDFDGGAPLECDAGCAENLIAAIRADKLLTVHESPATGFAGIVSLSKGPMIIATQPIRTSTGEGPVRGTLIMGRYLTAEQIRELGEVTHLSVTIRDWDPLTDAAESEHLFGDGGAVAVHPANASVVSGYTVINDIHGDPAFLMRVDLPRSILNQGTATLTYFLVLLLLAGIAFGIVTILLLEKEILSRIFRLHRGVTSITALGDPSSRLEVGGDDEIADFAEAVNRMLGAITASERELTESRDRYQLLFNSGTDLLFVYSLTDDGHPGGILKANEAAKVRLGYGGDVLAGMAVSEIVDPHSARSVPEKLKTGMQEDNALFRMDLLARDGSKIPVEAGTRRVVFDGRNAVFATARDITDRVRAERELELYRLHLEELVDLRTMELKQSNARLQKEVRERERTECELEEYRLHLEEMVRERTEDLQKTTDELTREIQEREMLERQKMEAYEQIARNMEQFAILNDHIRNPLQVIVGIASLEGGGTAEKILGQATVLNEIVTRLDRGWIESEKIRAFLRKHYGEE